jgi:hypothetical protein
MRIPQATVPLFEATRGTPARQLAERFADDLAEFYRLTLVTHLYGQAAELSADGDQVADGITHTHADAIAQRDAVRARLAETAEHLRPALDQRLGEALRGFVEDIVSGDRLVNGLSIPEGNS